MKNKTVFRREAAAKNIRVFPPPIFFKDCPKTIDLSDVISQYSQLRLETGWHIFSSRGQVYAVVNGVKVSPDDLLAGVNGDESPLSYLQASVFYHHLMEYSDHKTGVISQAIIDDDSIAQLDLLGHWNFGSQKRSFNPIFFYDSLMHPAVIFFTYHQEGMEVIRKHVHRFSYESYKLKILQRTWARIS
ncbi:hypothetical protein SAMN04487936_108138 [Halobacillus dabanensis]|uniref:Uncharacterized protein n=1 Tax=Halobacillus dabanensis TaxID=240302 RepID=A0A1I3XDH7_HALDA|nr:hypothetical protein [Halobacillus dabanensis]SFK17580.1 hypothetical protein SAMN04487936_108138 [Halobacillus dabanensis]